MPSSCALSGCALSLIAARELERAKKVEQHLREREGLGGDDDESVFKPYQFNNKTSVNRGNISHCIIPTLNDPQRRCFNFLLHSDLLLDKSGEK